MREREDGSMVKTQDAMSARARARRAKAELDAQRAETDRQIVDAATEFYEGAEARHAALAAVTSAEQRQVDAVARLSQLGQSVDEIAALCGLTAKDVRELRKAAAGSTKTVKDQPEPADDAAANTSDRSTAAA